MIVITSMNVDIWLCNNYTHNKCMHSCIHSDTQVASFSLDNWHMSMASSRWRNKDWDDSVIALKVAGLQKKKNSQNKQHWSLRHSRIVGIPLHQGSKESLSQLQHNDKDKLIRLWITASILLRGNQYQMYKRYATVWG